MREEIFEYLDKRGVDNIVGAVQDVVNQFFITRAEATRYVEAWYENKLEKRRGAGTG